MLITRISNFRLVVAGLACVSAACTSGPGSTQAFTPLARAQVVARTESIGGELLDSVSIVATPVPASSGYATANGITAPTGEVSLTLQRFSGPVSPTQPDTVRVQVSATVLKRAYLNTQGQGVTLRDTILVTFVPMGETSPSRVVLFRFAKP
jgi:hypothetical protein